MLTKKARHGIMKAISGIGGGQPGEHLLSGVLVAFALGAKGSLRWAGAPGQRHRITALGAKGSLRWAGAPGSRDNDIVVTVPMFDNFSA